MHLLDTVRFGVKFGAPDSKGGVALSPKIDLRMGMKMSSFRSEQSHVVNRSATGEQRRTVSDRTADCGDETDS